jgi:hypothetical protein
MVISTILSGTSQPQYVASGLWMRYDSLSNGLPTLPGIVTTREYSAPVQTICSSRYDDPTCLEECPPI